MSAAHKSRRIIKYVHLQGEFPVDPIRCPDIVSDVSDENSQRRCSKK